MLGESNISAVLAVKDLTKAKDFYSNVLGLNYQGDEGGGLQYTSGKGRLLVYESKYAGTNQATAAGWTVNDLGPVVEGLKAKGVSFEHYDMPGVTREGDIHVMGNMRAVWFKDPDGNILAIDEEK